MQYSEQLKKWLKIFARFNSYLFKYRNKQLVVLFLGLVSIVLRLVSPYFVKLIVDEGFTEKNLRLFVILALAAGAAIVLIAAIENISAYLKRFIFHRINYDLNIKIFEQMKTLDLTFFQDRSTGEQIYHLSYDTEYTADFIAQGLPEVIMLALRMLALVAIIFFMNWKIALFSLAVLPLTLLHPYYFSTRLRNFAESVIKRYERLFSRIQEIFTNIVLVKIFGREDYETGNFKKISEDKLNIALKGERYRSISGFIGTIASRIILGLIIAYAGYWVVVGRMQLGQFTAISIYLTQMLLTQRSLLNFLSRIATETVSGERIAEILDRSIEKFPAGKIVSPAILQKDIGFKNIAFGYQPGKTLFKNLNFKIFGGSKVALVGVSGCGKTTLVNLLLKLYTPWEGEIFIGGERLNELDADWLRENIGIALQQTLLWNDSVRHNIQYGDLKADFSAIVEAAKIAEIHRFIENLPCGYDTLLGERGCKISEGQKQRIAIARAVIKRPKILILDEALSSVDAYTESKIIDNLKLHLDRTILIVISHRLSTILKADKVYFIDNQGKVFSGKHSELLSRSRDYRAYLAQQPKEGILSSFQTKSK